MAFIIYVAVSLLAILIVTYCSFNTLLRFLLVRTLRRKDAFQSCGAPISLEGASLTFGCRRKLVGVDGKEEYSYVSSSKREERSCWNLELSNLHIGNAPNHNGDKTPYALHLNTLRVSVSGPWAFLSLAQLAIAKSALFGSQSSLMPRLLCNGLDFMVGFRVRQVEMLEIKGLSVYYIEGSDNNGCEERQQQSDVKTGLLWLKRGTKHKKQYFFVLGTTTLSWYESDNQGLVSPDEDENHQQQYDGVATNDAIGSTQTKSRQNNRKSRGLVKLFPSSSVDLLDENDQQFGLEVISDTHCLVLHARSEEERGAWVNAINDVIAKLRYSNSGGGCGNAPWLEVNVAEANARKVRWQGREELQRQKWLQQWQSIDDGQMNTKDDDAVNNSDDVADNNEVEEDDDDENDGDEDASDNEDKNFLAGIRNALDGRSRRSHAKTKRFEDSLEWRIGRMEIQQINLFINDRTHVRLDEDGWRMTGFIGSSKELRTHLRLNLGPKLLKDSSGHAIKSGISEYTGKDEYVFGDLTKAAVSKVGAGITDVIQDFTGKEEYEFGDITKTVVAKSCAGVADAVQDFTGKDRYVFGDLSRTVWSKLTSKLGDQNTKEL
jgi:hypothetical protein